MSRPQAHLDTEESARYGHPMSDRCWREQFAILREGLDAKARAAAQLAAQTIAAGIATLDLPMERYCARTCPQCEDPCCNAGKVFYRQADLLYLQALGEAIPPGQTRQRAGDPCRYLGPAGCLLPRRYRPYVCTWFLCAPQMECFQKEPPARQRHLIATLVAIRTARLELEAIYADSLTRAPTGAPSTKLPPI